MVRNTKGGSKHKKLARKNVNTGVTKTRMVDPNEPLEMYANVVKMNGFDNCDVICNDGIIRLCIIRKKFRGRFKNNNMLSIDSKVLVGLRDWEVVKEGKKQKCDLLEVYDAKQYNDIKNDTRCNWNVLMLEKDRNNTNDDMIEFSEYADSKEMKTNIVHSTAFNFDSEDEDLDIDTI